jgi:hypothetical protein
VEPIEVTKTEAVFKVTNAPDRSSISLMVLADSNSQAVKVEHDIIWIGYPERIGYRVVGWDPFDAALEVERYS